MKYSEANTKAFFQCFAQHSTAKFVENSNYNAIVSKTATWPNSVFSFQVNDENANAKIDELLEEMKLGHLPSQLRTPPNLGEHVLNLLREKSARIRCLDWNQ